MDVCHWTAADADGISVDADAKISASAHLCECRLGIENIIVNTTGVTSLH